MSTKGSLTDCSVPEIFQLIEKGQKTGLLKLCASSEHQASLSPIYYIWVHQGRIVAVANQLDQRGLVSLIAQHQGVNTRLVVELVQSCPLDQPLGLCLKNRLVLEAKQLKQLFKIQVLQQVCPLFQINDGEFTFYQNVPLPTREMTGLGLPLATLNQYCSINTDLDAPTAICS